MSDVKVDFKACARRQLWANALQLLAGAKKKTLEPGPAMHSAASGACRSRWRVAMCLLTDVESLKVELLVISHNSAMSCGGSWPWVLRMVSRMQLLQLRPDGLSLSALRATGESKTTWRWAVQLGAGLCDGVIAYNSLLDSCVRAEEWQAALTILWQMSEQQLQADIVSYSTVISGCVQVWPLAIALFHEAQRNIKTSLDAQCCTAVMRACAEGGQWLQALAMLSTMEVLKVRQDTVAFSAAITACERGSRWPEALSLLDTMQRVHVQRDVVAWNAVMSACENLGEWQVALHLLDSMELMMLHPDAISYNACLSSCEKGSQWQVAVAILSTSTRRDVISYNAE